jgi:hypothetical protein
MFGNLQNRNFRMNTAIDLRETTVLATNRLRKTGEEYSLVFLSARHIGQILALQETGFAELAADERHYLIKKDRAFFEKHFAAGNNMLGVVHDNKLVAQSIIVNPTAAHPKTGMTDIQLKMPVDTITILQGVIVDPACRGNNLMGVMVDTWLAEAEKAGRTEVISECAVENLFSWFVFLKKGLHIESIGRDPADGTGVYHLHGRLPSLSEAFNQSAKKSAACAQTDMKQQKKLLAKGYKGTAFDPDKGTLEFRRVRKNLRCHN